MVDSVYVLYVCTGSGDIRHYAFSYPISKESIEIFLKRNLSDEYQEDVEPPYYQLSKVTLY